MRQTKKLETLHENALKQFDSIQLAVRDEREQCLEDRRFCTIPGAQWEGPLGEQYENKPKFEVNKVHLSVIRIINEYRNNRISVNFTPRKEADDKLAELCNGLFRGDEQDSDAQEAYDNAFEEAVQGGMGAFRFRAEYEDEYDEDNDQQRIKIEPIYDADSSVFFDLDAKRQDKSDAKHCFVVTSMTPESYEEEWDEEPKSWPVDMNQYEFDWASEDLVYVAEYYQIEDAYDTLVTFESIVGDEEKIWEKDLDDDRLEELGAIGSVETSRRKIKRRKVHKYILSGGGILEDCGYIAGKEIPIIPVYGKRWMVDSIERCMGHVRLAKDAQRLKNMQLSKLGEISALSSVEKPIFTPEQMAGHQVMWAEDNIKDYSYLLVNPLTNEEGQVVASGPIGYTKPSAIPPAMAALLTITEEDMKDILGRPENGDQIQSHISGKAVELVQTRLDMQTYIYMSNFAKAQRRGGEVWISMAKELYIEDERDMKVVDPDGKIKSKKIMVTQIGEGGETQIANNLQDTDFDVDVEVGPSSNSKRDAIVRQATAMLQYSQDPQDQSILSSFIMMNMEGDGISSLREYSRKKLVKQGVIEPTEEDMEEMQMQPDQPSPQDQYALSEAERAEAEAAKYRADTVKTIADAELKRAQAAQIQFEMQRPPEQPEAPQEAPNDFAEEKLFMEAQKTAKELELKEREIGFKEVDYELKKQQLTLQEQEQAIRLAEAAISAEGNEQAEEAVAKAKDALSEKMVAVVESLQKTMEAQSKEAGKPRKIVREDGKIVGIE
jgi:hypothetical protein